MNRETDAVELVELGTASTDTQGAGGPYPEGTSTMLVHGITDE